MPRPARRAFPPRTRTGTNWGRLIASAVVVPSASKVLIASVSLSNPGIGEVVRRTRGVMSVLSGQGLVNNFQRGALGMIVVTDTALAAGASAIPGPGTDLNDDGWFLWVPFSQNIGATAAGNTSADQGNNRYDFDSKAMRKVEEGYSIAVMLESVMDGDDAQVAVSFSMLTSRIG